MPAAVRTGDASAAALVVFLPAVPPGDFVAFITSPALGEEEEGERADMYSQFRSLMMRSVFTGHGWTGVPRAAGGGRAWAPGLGVGRARPGVGSGPR